MEDAGSRKLRESFGGKASSGERFGGKSTDPPTSPTKSTICDFDMMINDRDVHSIVTMASVNSHTCRYCYIDLDVDDHRSKLASTAAFVNATDSRYGFCSKDVRRLGGSELSRIYDLMSSSHEWSGKIPQNFCYFPPCGSRIIFNLYWDIAPLACENFATLCTNGGNLGVGGNCNKKPKPAPIGESGKELTYRNSVIHRVVKGFIVQGGDFVFGNGSGGESIYNGKKFKDERLGLGLKHDRAGILSMGNSGKNSNTSQFFVALDKAPQCDGKHVVFGEVVSGMEVITALEQHATPAGGEPTVPIKITDCGAFIPLITPGAGYWYDRPDSESYSGFTPEFMARPRIGILAPSKQVAERFRIALGEHASTLLVAVDDVGGDDEQIIPRLMEQLENFALDLVMAAPACSQLLKQMDLPASWSDATKNFNGDSVLPKREQVFIEAKPADAIAAVLNETWVANMRLSWMLSASFRTV